MSSAPGSTPHAPSSSPGRGRPRRLDEVKRREICALVSGGCGLREAARYVSCSVNTIRREAERNAEIGQQLRRSEMYAQLSPLRAMQQAVATHWRAAAWFLERAYPHRFARRDPSAFGPKQARRLLHEVLEIIGSEITDPIQHSRVERRLRATFEYSIRDACDRRRTDRELRQAMQFFDEKDRLNDPLTQFGFPTTNLETLLNPKPRAKKAPDPQRPGEHSPRPQPPAPVAPPTPRNADDAPVSVVDFAKAVRVCLNQAETRLATEHSQMDAMAGDAPQPAVTDPAPPIPNNP